MAKAKKSEESAGEGIASVETDSGAVTTEFPDSIAATGKFEVVAVGEQARVYNKSGSAISGIIPVAQANDLAYSHSRRDPESH